MSGIRCSRRPSWTPVLPLVAIETPVTKLSPQESEPVPPRFTPSVRTTGGLILLAALLAMTLLLVVQNFQTIEIRFLRADFRVRLGWALVIAAVSGSGLSILFAWIFRRR
jgi:uncharacterized integral membrane protein